MKDILNQNIERLIEFLDKKNIEQLIDVLGSKKQIVKRNFLAGIFRGMGFGVGVTSVTTVIIYFFEKVL